MTDWAALDHAYGPAEDVPELLDLLLSDDPEARADARFELYSSIAHQGTRYAASAPAAPVLLELIADPATPDRGDLIGFAEFLAKGNHADWRPYPIAAERAAGPTHALAAYDAVAAGVPLFAALAGDPDAEIAVPAATALAVFPEHGAVSGPALAAVAADDDAPAALTVAALLALGLIAAPIPAGLLRARLTDTDETARWAAAVTAVRTRAPGPTGEAAALLGAWVARLAEPGNPCERPWWRLREDIAAEALAEFDPAGHADRIRPVLDALLAETPASNWHNHLIDIVHRAGLRWLGHGPQVLPWESLEPLQRHLVTRLCDRPDIFAGHPRMDPLRWTGLPDTLDGLRAYAGRA